MIINWIILIAYGLCFFCSYRTGKYYGFCEGLSYMKINTIKKSAEGHEHYCNVTHSNVVCFEREGELWVKEYCGMGGEREGRTYMVFYCPWCGYQTGKSKMHEKVNIKRLR